MLLKSVWVWVDWFVTANGPNLTWFKLFSLNLLFLCETPLDWLELMVRTVDTKLHKDVS